MKEDLPDSDEIISATEVQTALDRLARKITASLGTRNPLVITVMNGGLVVAGQLLPRLAFARECSYVHVRRYGAGTLAAIRARLFELGATDVLTAAFALKERATPAAIAADFTGVRASGLGRWRKLPTIRAL